MCYKVVYDLFCLDRNVLIEAQLQLEENAKKDLVRSKLHFS